MGGNFTLELKRLLTEAGCRFERTGKGDHDIWFSPHTGMRFPEGLKNPAGRGARVGFAFLVGTGLLAVLQGLQQIRAGGCTRG